MCANARETISKSEERFNQKIKNLEISLPALKKGVNCAELTLTSILDILGVDNILFHNAAIPLASGFGGYKSKKGWMGPCGAVSGGCAAIGVIMGGNKETTRYQDMPAVYLTAKKFAQDFEKDFGSVVCSELCGYDLSDPTNFLAYLRDGTWTKKCYKFVVWSVDEVGKLTKRHLATKWGMQEAEK
ncbi:MAG: C-GCAxxG-C-C family protein [Promethearchaeati archaeon SRVP18_Atabeyarchaeia-1]